MNVKEKYINHWTSGCAPLFLLSSFLFNVFNFWFLLLSNKVANGYSNIGLSEKLHFLLNITIGNWKIIHSLRLCMRNLTYAFILRAHKHLVSRSCLSTKRTAGSNFPPTHLQITDLCNEKTSRQWINNLNILKELIDHFFKAGQQSRFRRKKKKENHRKTSNYQNIYKD